MIYEVATLDQLNYWPGSIQPGIQNTIILGKLTTENIVHITVNKKGPEKIGAFHQLCNTNLSYASAASFSLSSWR